MATQDDNNRNPQKGRAPGGATGAENILEQDLPIARASEPEPGRVVTLASRRRTPKAAVWVPMALAASLAAVVGWQFLIRAPQAVVGDATTTVSVVRNDTLSASDAPEIQAEGRPIDTFDIRMDLEALGGTPAWYAVQIEFDPSLTLAPGDKPLVKRLSASLGPDARRTVAEGKLWAENLQGGGIEMGDGVDLIFEPPSARLSLPARALWGRTGPSRGWVVVASAPLDDDEVARALAGEPVRKAAEGADSDAPVHIRIARFAVSVAE